MANRATEQDRPLHILTVNVRGLKTNDDKLIEIERKISENKEVDVVFLTETRIGENDKDKASLKKFEDKWKIFPTRSNSSSKGAAILLNKKRDFRCLPEIVDESGRYVIVSCWISGTLCTFVSVYHHRKERGLLKELSEKKIKPPYTDILVVGGNFNTALDAVKDTSKKKNNDYNIIREELLPFLGEHDLLDAWREKHPDEREYTYDHQRGLQSRLDYFFIDAEKRELIQDCIINKDKIADRRPVSLFLDLKDRKLKIFSCAVHDLPRDEDLAELCPDIILLTKGQADDEEYIKKLIEEQREESWIVLWSIQSNAAILVAEGQRGIQILFTVYNEHYVILHCIVLGMLHTFVSVCHPTEEILRDMLKEITPSYSGRKVIGGDFSNSEQTITELMRTNEFNIPEGGSTQSRYLIHAQVRRANETEEQISGRPYSSLILHLPEMNPEGVDNIIQSLGQLKIHH